MSTQQHKFVSKKSLIRDIDRTLACIGKSYIMYTKFELGKPLVQEDLDVLLYFKHLLNRESCDFELTDCIKEKIYKITLKYV